MSDDDPAIPANGELRTPLEALRMDKTAFSVISLKDSGNDKEFWRNQSPAARLQALELMRQVMYGYDPISDRVERVLSVIERAPR
jgi:hypothetical protein